MENNRKNKWVTAILCGALALSVTGCGANEENKITVSWNDLNTFPAYLNQEYTQKMDEINKQKQAEIEAAEKAKAEAEAAKAAKANQKNNAKKEEAAKPLPSSTETALKKEHPTVEGVQEYTPSTDSPKDGDIKYENGKKYIYVEAAGGWCKDNSQASVGVKQGATAEEVQKAVDAPDSEKHGY